MEKGHTAKRYVSVWPREAVNNAGEEAIAMDGTLLWELMSNWGNYLGRWRDYLPIDIRLSHLVTSVHGGAARDEIR